MKTIKFISVALLSCLPVLLGLTACSDDSTGLSVEHAWVREAPPGARVQAGFMELYNNSKQQIKITAIESPAFANIEMHRMFMQDGMMRMQQQEDLVIPAGGKLKLEPGGYHLMLFDPVRYLKTGDAVRFTLTITSGKRISVEAIVNTGMGSQS